MQVFIRRPNIELLPGVRVTKDTVLEYKKENIEQKVENLTLHTVMKIKGEGYESTNHTTIFLNEGDVLVFEEEGRGYIKPLEDFVTIADAIEDLTNIKDLG